jgi:hypothetical protein
MNPNPFQIQNREQPAGRLGFGVGFYSISHWRTANQVQMVNVDDRTTTDDDGDPKPRMKPAVSSKPSRDGERNTEDSREKREREGIGKCWWVLNALQGFSVTSFVWSFV